MTTGELYNMIGILLNKYAVERFGYNGDPLYPNDYTLTVVYNRIQTEWAERIAHSVMFQNEATERDQYILHLMTDTATVPATSTTNSKYPNGSKYQYYTTTLPCSRELLSIVKEVAICDATNTCSGETYEMSIMARPLKFVDVWNKLKDPFYYRTGKVYRLPDIERTDDDITLNYVSNDVTIKSIKIDYIESPAPVIFIPLMSGMSINGETEKTPTDEVLKFPDWVYKELASGAAIEILRTMGIGIQQPNEEDKQ